jgi:hypothetical protein
MSGVAATRTWVVPQFEIRLSQFPLGHLGYAMIHKITIVSIIGITVTVHLTSDGPDHPPRKSIEIQDRPKWFCSDARVLCDSTSHSRTGRFLPVVPICGGSLLLILRNFLDSNPERLWKPMWLRSRLSPGDIPMPRTDQAWPALSALSP